MNINKIKEDKYEIDERTLNLLIRCILHNGSVAMRRSRQLERLL